MPYPSGASSVSRKRCDLPLISPRLASAPFHAHLLPPTRRRRYLERAISFAKRANSGVADVDLPVLVLMSNKTEPDRCMLDIQAATE